MLADDYDGVLGVAREQVEYGAHALDVCVARDRARRRARAADARSSSGSSMGVEAPLMIDTPRAAGPARGARDLPRPRDRQLHQHGERPRPHRGRTCRWSSSTARRSSRSPSTRPAWPRRATRSCAWRAGSTTSAWTSTACAPEDLIFDALTFTLATGDEEWIDSAVETIEGIRADQARAARRADLARRLERLLRPLAARAHGRSTRSSCTTAWRPGSTWRWSTRRTPWPTWRSRPRSASSPTTWSTTGAPDALPRLIAHFDELPAEAPGDEREDKFAGLDGRRAHPPEDPAPRPRGHRGGHRRGARRARRARERRGRRPAQRRAAAGHEGRRRPLRRAAS